RDPVHGEEAHEALVFWILWRLDPPGLGRFELLHDFRVAWVDEQIADELTGEQHHQDGTHETPTPLLPQEAPILRGGSGILAQAPPRLNLPAGEPPRQAQEQHDEKEDEAEFSGMHVGSFSRRRALRRRSALLDQSLRHASERKTGPETIINLC